MNNLKGKKLKLTKISDDVFEGSHPNGINVEYIAEGWNVKGIEIEEQLFLFPYDTDEVKLGNRPIFWTSMVEAFDEERMELKTLNSTYKIEIIK